MTRAFVRDIPVVKNLARERAFGNIVRVLSLCQVSSVCKIAIGDPNSLRYRFGHERGLLCTCLLMGSRAQIER